MKLKRSESSASETSVHSMTSALRRCFVQFPQARHLLEHLEGLLLQDTTVEEADNLLLLGEPGVGKSRLLKKFCSRHPIIKHEDFVEVPVLYASVPSKSSIDNLASSMLLALGSPFWNRGKTKELTHQLVTLLKTCKVKMVVLDEVNHLVDKGGIKTHHLIADWLKELSDSVRIPFVFAGIPRANRLLEANDQLRSRFREVVSVNPFNIETNPAEAEFREVLKSFENIVPSSLQLNISNATMTRRICFATGGRLRDIRRLMVRVIELACKAEAASASLTTFSTAFRQVIYVNAPDRRNPFTSKFDKLPLTRPGEPFAHRVEE